MNHRHAFIGLKLGQVIIYDIQAFELSSFSIEKDKSPVVSIECMPNKMHRLLIVHSNTVVVYSINKDLVLFTIPVKGILTASWLTDTEILVG